MNAFSLEPPEWAARAVHAVAFCCPNCKAPAANAEDVWLNRRSPVTGYDLKRKWQEFYLCECQTSWWAWSNDRPPSKETALENEWEN